MTDVFNEEKLKELLRKAYDAGWYGVRELKESAVTDIVNEYRAEEISNRPNKPIETTYNWSDVYQSAIFNYTISNSSEG